MKYQLFLVFAIAVFAVDSRFSSRSKHKSRVSSDGDQDPDTHQNRKIFTEEPVSIIVARGNDTPKVLQNITEGHECTDEAQKWKEFGNDELGPPISPEEFAKARNDSTLTAPLPDGGKAMEESGEYQGDIKLTPRQRAHMRKGRIATWALTGENRLWPNGILPYTIDSIFTERERQVIARAMEEFHDRTCLRFVGRTSETDYYHIISADNGCWSHVGHYGGMGQHLLSLRQGGCISFGVIIHELMHASGFEHEQNRNDRDNYISINWENIEDNSLSIFEKYSYVHGLGLPYDYQSVMHYRTHAFSKNGQPTITAKKEGVTLGQLNGFSELDVKGINLRYQCEVKCKESQCKDDVKNKCRKKCKPKEEDTGAGCDKDGVDTPKCKCCAKKCKPKNKCKKLNGTCRRGICEPGEKPIYKACKPKSCTCCVPKEGGSCVDGVSIGSQCLIFNQDTQTWEEAKSSCEAVGMKLASLVDPATVLEYTKETYGSVAFYVGGTDNATEGTWKWVNGQPISSDSSIFPWLPGEPNNYPPNGDEDCLVINFAGGFNDDVCEREKPFICEVV